MYRQITRLVIGGNTKMNRQTIEFAVKKTDGTVTGIGRSYIKYPVIQFTGSSIKWYEDRPGQQHSSKNG